MIFYSIYFVENLIIILIVKIAPTMFDDEVYDVYT